MQTETGNSETLYRQLQKLGASRASGVLSLQTDAKTFWLDFSDGKIVGIREEGINAAQTVAALLVDAGCVVDQVLELVAQAQVTVQQLEKILVAKDYVEPGEFQRALSAHELNTLYKLRHYRSWQIGFGASGSADLQPSSVVVAPAKLLLDLAELEEDEQRFNEIFGGLRNSEYRVYRLGDLDSAATEDERLLWNLVGEDGVPPLEIVEMSLLSDYALIVGLLGLHERALLAAESPVVEDREQESVADSRGQSSDNTAFEGYEDLFESDDSSAQVVSQLAARPERPTAGDSAADEFPPEFEPDSNKWNEPPQATHKRRRIFLLSLNYRLLEPSTVQNVVLAVMITFLGAVAMTAPAMFEDWFKALSNFTLNVD